MRNHLMGAALATAAFTIAAPASAATLLDLVDVPSTGTPYSFEIVATSTSTQLTFAGYHPPSALQATGIQLVLLGGTTNWLGLNWTYSPGGCSLASEYDDGAGTGTNALTFAGLCTGDYDSFSQSFASVNGAHYVLSFTYLNAPTFSPAAPSGFRVTTDAVLASAVPEPATWAMLLLGFGMVGGAMRSARVRKVTYSAA